MAGAGDVNGDGYADVIVGADAEAAVTFGADGGVSGPLGLGARVSGKRHRSPASSPAATLTGPDGAGELVRSLRDGPG